MAQDRELEIRLQFLEEATEYLNTIESTILELATVQTDNQIMDAVLRAAHSIKGGAAMMGFQTLSDLAHRLEDFFKVLRTQKPSIDSELESLLLAGVDRLRRVIALNFQGLEAHGYVPVLDTQWLEAHVNPVFDQLYQRLGEPTAVDAATLLSPEDEQSMVALIFESEVEERLKHLEAILVDPKNPCLFEEVLNMAQEFSGLGEMLQLNAFTSLCESITQHLEATPERIEEISHLALEKWRQSQAALIVEADTLPDRIDLDIPKPQGEPVQFLPTIEHENDTPTLEIKTVNLPVLSEPKQELTLSTNLKDNHENTVRVPIKLLDQLNDLFGELTIQRNGLNTYIERLRSLVKNLSHRVRRLQRFDTHLHTTDGLRGQTGTVPSIAPLLERRTENNEDALQQETSDNKFDRLEINRNSDLHMLPLAVKEDFVRIQEVTDDIDLSLEDTDQTVSELNRTAKQLQTSLTQVRMRPLSDLVGRFPRFVRELSLEYGKNIDLKIHGDGTLIDRTILEALSDPLMHLLRNAFDHGIEDPVTRQTLGKPEQGVIEITAAQQGNQTLISVSDDGGGIDPEKIRQRGAHLGLDAAAIAAASDEELLSLIFEPGFSTAAQVTALSGRGVGLDVVRTNLRQIRGDIKVDTQLRLGTTFTLSVPLTLSIAKVLLVESNGMLLAFPSDAIEEMLLPQPEQIFTTAGSEVLSWKEQIAPLIRLEHWLQFRRCPHKKAETETMSITSVPTVLIVAQGNKWVAIQVDRCWGEQEVAIRSIEGAIALPPGFTGCTILGDGRVVPLVNVPQLLHWLASCKQSNSLKQEAKSPTTTGPQSKKDTILVVDDSINVRRFLSLTLEKAGYRVEQATDGQDALEKLSSGMEVRAVLCDIDMPRLDGYGLLARIKSNPAFDKLPVTMLTSRSGHKDRQIAMNLGAKAYFSKPYNEQELLQTLKQLLQK